MITKALRFNIKKWIVLTLIVSVTVNSVIGQEQRNPYKVTWNSPSKDSKGSMPIGNGDIGANVWVEENGDLLFFLSKGDAWSENGRLLKLGKVRVSLSPSPFSTGSTFTQTLDVKTGKIFINGIVDNNTVALEFSGGCESSSCRY